MRTSSSNAADCWRTARERDFGVQPVTLSAAQVGAFLAQHHRAPAQDLEQLSGGFWSSAWGYRVGEESLVARFGQNAAWFEADRSASAFAREGLPIPQVREIGPAFDDRVYAISVRHYGTFLEDTPATATVALASTLTKLLVALYCVPGATDAPVLWHTPSAPAMSWREYLLTGLVDHPDSATHGWSNAVAQDPKLASLTAKVDQRIRTLVDACPERRDLVHGDLLHGNVLINPSADRVTAVISWKCSVRGDFLYDAAWCTFWSPWHEGIAAVEPLAGVLNSAHVRQDPTALADAALRHHCYELQIGFTHLGWNIWTNDDVNLKANVRRLSEILERGPLTTP
jgi:aminoglycoside phosphotransferase (APT) family kinase protein